jgi:hypothetical protein
MALWRLSGTDENGDATTLDVEAPTYSQAVSIAEGEFYVRVSSGEEVPPAVAPKAAEVPPTVATQTTTPPPPPPEPTVLPGAPASLSNADLNAFADAWMRAGFAQDATARLRRNYDWPYNTAGQMLGTRDPNLRLQMTRGTLVRAVSFNNGYIAATFSKDGNGEFGKNTGGDIFTNFVSSLGSAAQDFAAMPGMASALFIVTGGATLALDNRDEIARQVIIDFATGAAIGTAAGVAAGTIGTVGAGLATTATGVGADLAVKGAEEVGLDVVPDPPPATTSPGELDAIDQGAQDADKANRTAMLAVFVAAGVLLFGGVLSALWPGKKS